MCGCVVNTERAKAMYSKYAYFFTDKRQNKSNLFNISIRNDGTEGETQVYST